MSSDNNGNGVDHKPVKDWTNNQRRVLDWLALSKYDRFPATQRELAKELGVNEATVSRWISKMPRYAVTSAARELLVKEAPEVFYSLTSEAKKGSYQHQKLYLELIGEYRQGMDITSGGEPLTIQFIREQRHDSNADD